MDQVYFKKVQELLGGFFAILGSEAEIAGEEKDRYLFCQVVLPQGGEIIRSGEEIILINSLQYLVNRSLTSATEEEVPRVVLDINGHRAKREEKLVKLGEKLIQEVKETGGERILEPLDPRERRVIHLAVAEVSGVSTRSVGEDFQKNVVIFREEADTVPEDASSIDPS